MGMMCPFYYLVKSDFATWSILSNKKALFSTLCITFISIQTLIDFLFHSVFKYYFFIFYYCFLKLLVL